jgi:hypothetical protein
VPRRAFRRTAVLVPAVLSGLLAVPPVAHAQASPSLTATQAFVAGQSAEAPVVTASAVMAEGDLVQGGTITQTTAFGSTTVEPLSPGKATGFVARYSADGSQVRWVLPLQASPRPVGISIVGGTAVVTVSGVTNPPFSSLTFGVNVGNGQYKWGGQTFSDLCETASAAPAPGGQVVVLTSRAAAGQACRAELRTYDGKTGVVTSLRTMAGTGDVALSQVAVGADGMTYVGGLVMGSLTLGGQTVTTAYGCSRELVAAFAPDGSSTWARTSDEVCGGYPRVDDLVVTPQGVHAWATSPLAPVAPSGPVNWLVSLDPATGADQWQRRLPFGRVSFEHPESAALALTGDGRLAVVAPFRGSVDLGGGRTLSATDDSDRYDLALVTVRATTGALLSADRLGGGGDDRVWSLLAAPGELDVVGAFDTATTSGQVAGAAFGRFPLTAATPTAPVAAFSLAPITWPTPLPADPGATFQTWDGRPVQGTVTYDPAPGTVLDPGSHLVTATFTSADPDYTGASVTGGLVVRTAVPVVTVTGPASIAYGTPLSPTATAKGAGSAALAGTFSYTPAPGTVLEVGDHTVTAVFTPADSIHYEGATATGTVTVTKAATSIVAKVERLKSQVSAVLTDTTNARPLPGKWVTFYFGSRTCVAQTDGTGTASCPLSFTDLATALRTGVSAAFWGDRNYTESVNHVAGTG